MAKGKRLSEEQMVTCFSNRKTAIEIGSSQGLIRKFLKKGEKVWTEKATSENTKLSNRQMRQIRFEAMKNQLNANQIKHTLDLTVTKQHIAYVLRHSEHTQSTRNLKESHT